MVEMNLTFFEGHWHKQLSLAAIMIPSKLTENNLKGFSKTFNMVYISASLSVTDFSNIMTVCL